MIVDGSMDYNMPEKGTSVALKFCIFIVLWSCSDQFYYIELEFFFETLIAVMCPEIVNCVCICNQHSSPEIVYCKIQATDVVMPTATV